MMPNPKCLVETCRRPKAAGCKGLCMICYSSAKKQVTAGKTTWEELAELGMADIEVADDLFTKEFNKRTKDA